MQRRTRRQIASDSSRILDAVKSVPEMAALTDEEIKDEIIDVVLSRIGDGAFDESQKQTLWQIATEDDIGEIRERYSEPQVNVAAAAAEDTANTFALPPRAVEQEEGKGRGSRDRTSESNSDSSDTIALNLLSSRIGKLSQTLGFGINRQNGKVEFEVEFGV